MNSPLTGVILCGGKSQRMGQDKGLIQSISDSWVQLAFQKFAAVGIPSVCSINATQTETYSKLFPDIHFIIDQVNIPGPLAGLLSAHLEFPRNDLFLLACDLPNLTSQTLQLLHSLYHQNRGSQFYAFYQDTRYEPMAAIYTAEGLQEYYQMWINGDITNYSLQTLLNNGDTFKAPMTPSLQTELHNFNTPIDLAQHAKDKKRHNT